MTRREMARLHDDSEKQGGRQNGRFFEGKPEAGTA